MNELTRVVEMIPARVVEIVPVLRVVIDPVEVVEIVPVLVVEMVPVLVVEMVPVFANVVADRAVTNNATQTTDLRFFIALLLVIPKVKNTVGRSLEFAAKPYLQTD